MAISGDVNSPNTKIIKNENKIICKQIVNSEMIWAFQVGHLTTRPQSVRMKKQKNIIATLLIRSEKTRNFRDRIDGDHEHV